MQKSDILETLRTLPYDPAEYWVITGGAMVLYGFREQTHDVDLGCTTKLADELEAKGFLYRVMDDGNRWFKLSDDVEVFENWLYDTVVSVEGVPVISIPGLLAMKQALGREKDLRDIRLIRERCGRKSPEQGQIDTDKTADMIFDRTGGINMKRNNVVDALIEIPLNSRNKYEVDHVTGRIHLDRVLYSAMSYPTEYGIIENTLAPDGDPLDILVICKDPTFPGCIVPARVLGYLTMTDGGKEDYKLISVVDCDPRYDNVQELSDLPKFILDEISNFFQNYKVLQGISVTTGAYHTKEDALAIIKECRQRFLAGGTDS